MTTWLSSDWHLGHRRILELCERPFGSVREMDRAIVDNALRVCRTGDWLHLLGDTVLGSRDEGFALLRELVESGVTVQLWPGNHDKWSLAYHGSPTHAQRALASGHAVTASGAIVLEDRAPSSWELPLGREGRLFNVSHFPYDEDERHGDRYAEWAPAPSHLPLVHGHVHGSWRTRGRQLNVGVDVWDFTPVHEDTVLEWASGLAAEALA